MTLIKICGFTQADQALFTLDLGVDFIGLVVESSSPRFVEESAAVSLLRALPPEAPVVAVCGSEIPDFAYQFPWIQSEMPPNGGHPWIRVVRSNQIQPPMPLNEKYRLLDAFSASAFGGTGEKVDVAWAVEQILRSPVPVFLAGGLNAENVGERISALNPRGVDVSSGVESAPGEKDLAKVQSFVAAVRSEVHL